MITYNPLWKTLVNKDMTKTQLREAAGFSTVTLSKLSKNEYVSLQIIDNICDVLQVKSITEILDYTSNDTATLEEIEYIVNTLTNNKNNGTEDTTKNQLMLYLLIEEFIENQMSEESKENIDKFLNLYSKCFKEKLLPQDLLDAINDLLKIQLF